MILSEIKNTFIEQVSQLSSIRTCMGLPRRADALVLPAVILELAEIERGKDQGSGELDLIAHWQTRLIVSENDQEDLAWGAILEILTWLKIFDWPDLNVGQAMIKGSIADHFSPEYQGHRVWLIEWQQHLRAGEEVWNGGNLPDFEHLYIHCGEHTEVLPIHES